MKTFTIALKGCVLLSFLLMFNTKTSAQDFNVQHLQDDIGNAGGTNTSFTSVSSTNSAFALANNNRKVNAGPNTSASTFNADDLAGARVLTNASTLTYYRQAGSDASNMRFNTSIWEYIGAPGGNNEMIVRGRYAINLNGTTNSVTQALSGISDANDCIPFITGIVTNKNSAGGDSGTAIAYLENATTLRVQKGTDANDVTVYITVVEFTGSNWTVLHGDSGNTGSITGNITLRSNSDGTGTASNVSAWNEAVIFSHHRGDTTDGANQALEDNWPLMDPGINNQTVDWNFVGTYGSNGTNRHFVHVLNNPNLNVSRFQNSSSAQGETTIDISSAGLTDTNQALIIGSSTTTGGGTAYARGWRNYYFNSSTQAAHWSHRSGNTMSHEIQIVDLSALSSATCATIVNTFPYSEDFETAGSNWVNSTADDFDWTRDSGGTPSSGTGPTSGNGDTWYIYIEASSPNFPTRIADVFTPCFDLSALTNATFSYSYHMFGADVGTLDIDLSTDNGATFPINLRSFSGNYGNVWNTDSINLTPYVGQTVMLRFRGTSGSTGNGWSSDIAIDNVSITSAVTGPEINIQGNGTNIVDGDTTPSLIDNTDFGDVDIDGSGASNSFTIENLGSATLNLTGASPYVTISGLNAADFNVSTIPNNAILPSNSTTFIIDFTPGALGLRTATVTITSNDVDEGTYTFDIQGNGIVVPNHTIYYEHFDDSDGGWTASTGSTTVWSHGNGLTSASELGEGNYWYSDNYANYDNNINITLTSPILSTTGYTNLVFNADLRYDFSNDTDDGMRLEYRRRTLGVWSSWSVVGSFGDGSNWYDGNGNVNALGSGSDGWTGNTDTTQAIRNYFETASVTLPIILENSAEIQFRFVMASDAADTDLGAAIDNIIINAASIVPFSDPTHGPGSINSDLRLWIKATEGWGLLNDNDDIDNLPDAAFDNDATGIAGNSPAFKDNSTDNINYNPVMEFDRSNLEYLRGKGGYFAHDYFVVIKSNGTIDYTGANRQVPIAGRVAPVSPQVDGTGLGLGNISRRFADEVVAHMSSSVPTNLSATNSELSYGRAYTSTTDSYVDEVIIYNVKTNAAGNAVEIFKNGKRIDNTAGFAYDTGIPGFTDQLNLHEYKNQQYYLGVGRFSLNGNVDAYVDGRITEIVSYKSTNSDLDKQKIESYLALKNGVTLHAQNSTTVDRENDIDYIDSQGNVIWDTSANTGYNYDIAGIGRDDDSNFLQKQSASENKFSDGTGLTSGFLSIGLTDVYDTNKDNIDNNATNFNDREYLVWGNNNADINSSAATITVNMSAGITPSLTTNVTFTAMQRVWKVVESGGDIPTATVMLPQDAIRNISPPGNYYMFISNTGVFDPTADYRVMTSDGSGNLKAEYDFDGTKYITFGYAPQVEVVRSVYFDGAVDYIDIEDNLDLDPTGFTISAWIKRDAADSGTKSILSKRDLAFTQGYDFEILDDNRIQVYWKNGSNQITITNTSIPDDEWHHVAAIYNGTRLYIYIDGVLDISRNRTAPITTSDSFLIAAAGKGTTTQHFQGNIDEVRVWNTALTEDQLRFVMNQEIEDNAGQVMGRILPTSITKNDINAVPWSDLAGYYPMSVYTYTNTDDASGNGNQGALRNLDTVDRQTAPLPYESAQNGDWDTNATWTNGSVQYIPGTASIVDNSITVDWNIVRTSHNVTMDNSALPSGNNENRTVLGLYVDANELTLDGDNATNAGNGITVSHYLSLTGKIDLEGDSQLIQTEDSDLIVDTNGELEKDQQGTADTYTYNYWSAPVGDVDIATNNYRYTVQDVMFDNTNPVNFLNSGYDGSATNPISIADYWIWKFANLTSDDYSAWQHVRRTGNILPGEGFTMKGPATGGILDDQNYVFLGKPNNGDITLTINNGNDYLVGNPYASALDADEFILDNPNTTGALQFWEHWGGGSHVLQQYQGGYAIYNLSGGVPAPAPDPDVAQVGVGTKTPGRYVPVSQGFFVTGISNGNITFENDQRAFVKEGSASSVFMRTTNWSNNQNNEAEDLDNRMKFRIGYRASNTMHLQRELLLTIDENTTEGVDWAYDAHLNEDQTDDMFWMIGDEKFVIQANDNANLNTVYPLGVKTSADGISTFAINTLENVPNDVNIYLHDKALNLFHDLRISNYEIFLNEGEYLDRFEIAFKITAGSLGIDDENLNSIDVLYSNDKEKIVLINPNLIEVKSIELFNMLGQSVHKFESISESGYSEYEVKNLSTGTYIIKLYTVSGSVSTKKVLVK